MSNPSKAKGDRRSHHVGMVGEGRFIAWASEQGWHLYRGLDGHTPCDFIVDTGERLMRVEVKRVEAVQASQRNYYYVTATKMDSKRYDALFISTPTGDYFIPAEDGPTQTISIKQVGGEYERNITAPGKYEAYRV